MNLFFKGNVCWEPLCINLVIAVLALPANNFGHFYFPSGHCENFSILNYYLALYFSTTREFFFFGQSFLYLFFNLIFKLLVPI